MRLGGHFVANSIEELRTVTEKLDCYGLSAIQAPWNLAEMSDEESSEFGEVANSLDIVVGEAGYWENLMVTDSELQSRRIDEIRTLLQRADLMGCKTVVSLAGSRHSSGHMLAPDPANYTPEFRADFREVVLRILDGLNLQNTTYSIEPFHNSFFYQPEPIREFIDSVDHPSFGLHLDQMNMVSQATYFRTTELIENTFDLLAEDITAAHIKDIRMDHEYMFLKYDEVDIGDGVLDIQSLLNQLSELPEYTPCFCEHMSEEQEYVLNFTRLHYLAEKEGLRFKRRNTKSV
ncbi:MAG: sugar phosphate isomerase/epimerase [Candidatus Marinimicrobia bacterium]|nr:sugar phosphate isomerase/epimerase [Candidatus Neomarinimicrobiota bacterium]